MRKMGIESYIYVARECLDEKYIIAPKPNGYAQKVKHKLKSHLFGLIDRILKKIFIQSDGMLFSMNMFSTFDRRIVESINPDIINLHWICNNFISYKDLAYLCKRYHVVWTCHDSWPFTGGCHYAGDCTRYMQQCKSCPEISSAPHIGIDVSSRLLKKKKRAFGNYPLTAVGPSGWITNCAKKSAAFQKCKAYTIPNCIDTERYYPIDKLKAREMLCLPQDKPLLLFGAQGGSHDPRKGYDLLMQALKQSSLGDTELIVFGCGEPKEPEDMPYPVHYVGRLHDDISLIMLYNAADAFIAPSREDNLPNTIMEAMACGTPCVGFRIGGIPDEIEHMVTGYLAEPFDTSDLAKGIETVLENHEKMGMAARDKAAREYNMQKVGQQYLDLYEKILSDGK